MGKLAGLHEALTKLSAPPEIEVEEVEEGPDRVVEALDALVATVSGIKIPEVKIDLNTAVDKLVKALSRIRFPEHELADFGPIVDAIKGISLSVNLPPEAEKPEPCPYTFTIIRNHGGLMSKVVATPGIIVEVETPKPETEYE